VRNQDIAHLLGATAWAADGAGAARLIDELVNNPRPVT
jgi:hypothetical protein